MASVDERIVRMEFDNQRFEKNVKTSLTTLEKLKEALKFDKSVKELDNLQKSVDNFDFSHMEKSLDSLDKRFSAWGIASMTVISRLTNAAIDAGKAIDNAIFGQIKAGGWRRATNLEQARFQLQGILKNAEAVEEVISGPVMNAVDGTAYGADQAAKTASVLAASGITDLEQMGNALLAVSGAAAMTGRDYEDIGNIFSTVASNGKLMTMQLRQFAASGLNVSATLADYLKITEAEVNEMVTQGVIDFETFAKAMNEAFGKHAKDANKTFAGSLSNVKARLSQIGEAFASPAMKSGVVIFNDLRNVLTQVRDTIKDGVIPSYEMWLGGLTDIIHANFEVINGLNVTQNLFSGFINVGKQIANVFMAIGNAYLHVFPPKSIEQTAKTINSFSDMMKTFTISEKTLIKIKNIFGGIFTILKGLITLIKGGISLAKKGLAALKPIIDVLLSIMEVLAVMIMNFDAFKDVVTAVIEYTINNFGLLLEALGKMAMAIPQFFYLMAKAILESFGIILPDFSKVIDFIGTSVMGLVGVFGLILTPFQYIIGYISKLGDLLYSSFKKAESPIDFFKRAASDAQNIFSKFIESTVKGGKEINGFGSLVIATISGILKKIGEVGKNILSLNTITNKFGNGLQFVGNVLKGIISTITGFVTELGKANNTVKETETGVKAMSATVDDFSSKFKVLDETGKATGETLNDLGGKSSAVSNAVKGLGGVFQYLREQITATKIIAVGFIAILVLIIKQLFEILEIAKQTTLAFSKLMKGAGNFLNSLSTYINPIRSAKLSIMNFAEAVAILAGSIWLLSTIPSDKLIDAGIAIAGISAALLIFSGAMLLISKYLSKHMMVAAQMSQLSKTLYAGFIAFSLAIVAASVAFKILDGIDTKGILQKTLALSAIIAVFGVISIAVSRFAGEKSLGVFGLISFALSILLLVKALEKMSNVDFTIIKNKIQRNSIAIIGMLASLIALAAAIKIAGAGMASVGIGILAIVAAIKLIGDQDIDKLVVIMDRLIAAATIFGAMFGILVVIFSQVANQIPTLVLNYDILMGAFEKFGKGIRSIASALLIIVATMVLFKLVDEDTWNRAKVFLTGFGVFIAALVGVTHIMSENAKHINKLGRLLLETSAALIILLGLTAIVKLMVESDPLGTLGSAVIVFGALAALFTMIGVLSNKAKDVPKGVFATILASTAAIIGLVGSIAILTAIIESSNPMSILGAVTSLIAIMFTFGHVMAEITKSAKKVDKAAIGVMIVAVISTVAMSIELWALSKIPWPQLMAATAALSLTFLAFGKALQIIGKSAKKYNKASIGTMLVAILDIATITGALYFLSQHDWKSLLASGAAMSACLLTLAGSITLIGNFTGLKKGIAAAKSLAIASISLVPIGIGLSLVASYNWNELLGAVGGVGLCLAELTAVLIVLNLLQADIKKSIPSAGALAIASLSLIPIAIALSMLAGYDWKSLLASGAVMLEAMTALIVGIAAFSAIGPAAAAVGILTIGEVLAGIIGIFWLIGELNDLTGGAISGGVEKAAAVFSALGEAIGSFFGGIAKGFSETASEALPEIGSNLSAFFDNAEGFFEGVKKLDNQTKTGLTNLLDVVKDISQANYNLETIGDGSSFTTLGDRLTNIGKAIKAFSDELEGIDLENVAAGSKAAKALSEFMEVVPKDSGVIQFWTGTPSIDTFLSKLPSIGKSLVDFSASLDGLNQNGLKLAKSAAKGLSDFVNNLPNETVFNAALNNGELLENTKELSPISSNIKTFADNLSGIDTKGIEDASVGFSHIAEIVGYLGNNDTMDTLISIGGGTVLKDFGDKIREMTDAIKTADFTQIDRFKEGIEKCIESVKALKSEGAKPLSDFTAAVKNITSSDVGNVGKVAQTEIGKAIQAVRDATEEYKKVAGEAIKKYCAGISAKTQSLTSSGEAAASAFKSGLETIISKTKTIADQTIAGLVSGLTNQSNGTKIAQAGEKIAAELLAALEKGLGVASPSKEAAKIGKFVDLGLASGLVNKSAMKAVTTAAKSPTDVILNETAKGVKVAASNGTKTGTIYVKNAYKAGTQQAESHDSSMNKAGASAGASWGQGFTGAIKQAVGNFMSGWQSAKDWFNNALTEAKNAFTNNKLVKEIQDKIEKYRDELLSKTGLEDIQGQLEEAMGDVQVSDIELGEDIGVFGDSVAGNISNSLGGVSDTISDDLSEYISEGIEEGVEEGVEKADTSSPKYIRMLGIITKQTAFLASVPKVSKYAKGAVEKLAKAIDKTASKYSKGIDSSKQSMTVASGLIEKFASRLYKQSDAYKENKKQMKAYDKQQAELLKKMEDQYAVIKNNKEATDEQVEAVQKQVEAEMAKGTTFANVEDEINKRLHAMGLFVQSDIDKYNELYNSYQQSIQEASQLASEIAKGPSKALKELRKTYKEAYRDFMKLSNMDMSKVVSGFDAFRKSTNLIGSAVKSIDFTPIVSGVNDISDAFSVFSASVDVSIAKFDKFEKVSTVGPQKLLRNYKSQLKAQQEFLDGLTQMAKMGFDSDLIDELYSEGPSALGKIKGFLKMSQNQIAEYNHMQEKTRAYEAKAYAKSLNDQLNTYNEYQKKLTKIASMGYSQNVINAIKEAGIDAQEYLNTLLAADPSTVKQINNNFQGMIKASLSETDTKKAAEGYGKTWYEAMQNSIKNSNAFEDSIRTLMNAGFDRNMIDQLKSMGQEAAQPIIDELLGVYTDPKQVKKYNTAFRTYTKGGIDPLVQMADDIESKNNGLKNWNSYMKKIAKEVGKDSTLYKTLEEMGWESGYEYAQAYVQGSEEAKKRVNDALKQQDKLNTKAKIQELQNRAQTVKQMQDDISFLVEQRGLKGPLMEELMSYGPEDADIISELAQMSTKDFAKFMKNYNKNAKTKKENSFADSLIAEWAQVGEDTKELGKKAGKEAVKEFNKESKKQTKKTKKQLKDDAKDGGKNVLDGINEGLNNKKRIERINRSMEEIGRGIKDAFNITLKIKSPSRVMEESGKYIDEGIAKGLSSKKKTVVAQMQDMVYQLMATLDEDMIFDPIITPRLDLSQAIDEVGLLNSMFKQQEIMAGSINANDVNGEGSSGTTFIQNNYSPKALSRIEIYRQTNNLLSQRGRVVKR